MNNSSVFRIADLQNYVMTTSDQSWGKTATEFTSKKRSFLGWLASYKSINETEFIDVAYVHSAIHNIFLDGTQIENPNASPCSFTRTRAEWVFVNIECNCFQLMSI